MWSIKIACWCWEIWTWNVNDLWVSAVHVLVLWISLEIKHLWADKIVLMYAKQATWKHRWLDVESFKKYWMYTSVEVFELRDQRLLPDLTPFIFQTHFCFARTLRSVLFSSQTALVFKDWNNKPNKSPGRSCAPMQLLGWFPGRCFLFFFPPFFSRVAITIHVCREKCVVCTICEAMLNSIETWFGQKSCRGQVKRNIFIQDKL